MINLLLDTNVLIHLLHPTGNTEVGLTRQLLDWDRAGHVRIVLPAASAHEQGRSWEQLAAELGTLGLPLERVLSGVVTSDSLLSQINGVLGHRKRGDNLDAQIVAAAWAFAEQGNDTRLITGDRNILRHAYALHALGVPPVVTLRGAVNRLKAHFPLTISRTWNHA
ncbi:MAG: type II toxin-antitoxin system VapC family toxin [Chloroflexi bacterium]|nr:type II toxin-antitoxin system VapC family toxin [Chloroflexota bacterium]MCC6895028.1 type II toxin-antitoxin system VapC family toxin [Anaerolineae bacterium]